MIIAVERMDAGQAERAGRGFAVGRTEGFSGVFYEFHAMLITTGLDGSDVCRLTVEVDKDESLWLLASLGLLLNDRAGERGIHVPALFFRIDEDGLGTKIGDGSGGSDEGERGTKYFVTRAHAGETEGEMQRRGTGRDRNGMFRAYEDGEIFFKRVEIRARRRDPIGLEGFEDVFDFGGADVGRGEVDSVFVHKGKCREARCGTFSGGRWQPQVAGGGKGLGRTG